MPTFRNNIRLIPKSTLIIWLLNAFFCSVCCALGSCFVQYQCDALRSWGELIFCSVSNLAGRWCGFLLLPQTLQFCCSGIWPIRQPNQSNASKMHIKTCKIGWKKNKTEKNQNQMRIKVKPNEKNQMKLSVHKRCNMLTVTVWAGIFIRSHSFIYIGDFISSLIHTIAS